MTNKNIEAELNIECEEVKSKCSQVIVLTKIYQDVKLIKTIIATIAVMIIIPAIITITIYSAKTFVKNANASSENLVLKGNKNATK